MPTALVMIPDGLDKINGFLNYAHSFTRLLRSIGYRVDAIAHHVSSAGVPPAFARLYGRIYYPQGRSGFVDTHHNSLRAQILATLGRHDSPWVNHLLPAAALASIAPYDLYVIHHVNSAWIAPYLPQGSKKVLFTHYYQSVLDGGVNHHTPAQVDSALRAELAPCTGYDLVTTTGPLDSQLFLQHHPQARVMEFPHCPDLLPPLRLRRMGQRLLFSGYDNTSNRQALDWYVTQVYPILRRIAPHIQLHIMGRIDAYARLQGYDSLPGIVLHGFVARPAALFATCDLCLAIIVHGEGIKTRIIEALGIGLPVLTTTKGLINTRMQAGQEVVVADRPADMARLIVKTLESLPTRRALQRAGQQYVKKYHSLDSAQLQPLKDTLLSLGGPNTQPAKSKASRIAPAPTAAPVAANTTIQAGLQLLLPWVVNRCIRAKYRKVAIFGAGAHTATLIPMWRALSGPTIGCIICSTPSAATHIAGVPIVTLDQFSPKGIDAIVASSQTYEVEMAGIAQQKFPKIPFLTVWTPA